MFKGRSSNWVFWIAMIPITIALTCIANGIAFFEDLGELPGGVIGRLLPLVSLACFILLPISVIYFAWTNFKRASTRLRGFFWAVASSITQTLIIVVITAASFFAASFFDFIEPEFIGETAEEVQNLELNILESKYGIPAPRLGSVEHYSEWSIGEEMGRDFILVPLTEEHEKQVASISFDNIDVELPDDLSTSNLQFLCDVDNEVSISNTVIREFLCKHRDTPIRGNWNLIQVRQDWTVVMAYFPTHSFIWISEVEW